MARFNPLPPAITRPCWEFTLSGLYNSQTIVNVLHYVQSAGATTVPTLETVRSTLYTHLSAEFLALHHTDYVLNRVTAQRFDIPGSTVSVSDPDANGDVVGEGMPPNVSAGIRKVTQWPGQRGRGYMRIGGIGESAAEKGEYTVAFRGLLVDFATLLDESVPTANPTDGLLVPHVLTREIVYDPLPAVTVYGAEITGFLTTIRTGSQNSRKVRQQA